MNGTYVNDIRVDAHQVLHEGDRVAFGHKNGINIKPGELAKQNSEFCFLFEKVPNAEENIGDIAETVDSSQNSETPTLNELNLTELNNIKNIAKTTNSHDNTGKSVTTNSQNNSGKSVATNSQNNIGESDTVGNSKRPNNVTSDPNITNSPNVVTIKYDDYVIVKPIGENLSPTHTTDSQDYFHTTDDSNNAENIIELDTDLVKTVNPLQDHESMAKPNKNLSKPDVICINPTKDVKIKPGTSLLHSIDSIIKTRSESPIFDVNSSFNNSKLESTICASTSMFNTSECSPLIGPKRDQESPILNTDILSAGRKTLFPPNYDLTPFDQEIMAEVARVRFDFSTSSSEEDLNHVTRVKPTTTRGFSTLIPILPPTQTAIQDIDKENDQPAKVELTVPPAKRKRVSAPSKEKPKPTKPQSSKRRKSSVKVYTKDTCSSFDCKKPKKGKIDWVQCDDCDQWYHVACAGCDIKVVKKSGTQFHCGC